MCGACDWPLGDDPVLPDIDRIESDLINQGERRSITHIEPLPPKVRDFLVKSWAQDMGIYRKGDERDT